MKKRSSWKEYFFSICELVATRSTCIRKDVGCVIVSEDKRILATGYNGAPRKAKHCTKETCLRKDALKGQDLHKCKAVHAEQNAIAQAAEYGIPLKNSIMYCTDKPCNICIKIIINTGIKTVYYKNDYPDDQTDTLMLEPDIPLELIKVK